MSGALRYEWRRIRSIRATWILAACAVVLSGAFAFLFSAAITSAANSGSSGEAEGLDVSLAGSVSLSTTNLIVLVLLGTIAAQAFGQEYRHGTIRLTLTEFPKRTTVFVAKVVVCCAVILATFVIGTVVAYLILSINPQVVGETGSAFLTYFLRTCIYLIGFSLIVFAITVLTRILALGVIIPLAFAGVAETLLASLVGNYVSWLPDTLPFLSGSNFVAGNDMLRNGAVFGAWVAVLAVAGYIVFERRDA